MKDNVLYSLYYLIKVKVTDVATGKSSIYYMNRETRVNQESRDTVNMGVEEHKTSSPEDKVGAVFPEGRWSNAAQILGRVKSWHIGLDRIVILIPSLLIVVSGYIVNGCKNIN